MKRIVLVLGAICAMLVLGSCASQQYVFDESMPNENTTVIHYKGVLTITEYNGITVNWKGRDFGNIVLRFPGGETHFVFNGTTGTVNMSTTYNNIPFQYNFENGKEYTLYEFHEGIYIFSGKSTSKKDHIVTFNMRGGNQTKTMENGQRI
jgi:hypothetical protein